MSATPTARLSKASRREQLLDSTAELLLARGVGGITMEGLAAQAGVSKALPYVHFDNADDVLVELYRRELQNFGERVDAAMAAESGPDGRLRAAIHAYFDVVSERGAILSLLTGPGSSVPTLAYGGQRPGHRFVERIYIRELGVPEEAARINAAVLLGALHGAVDALARRDGSRREIEETIVDLALGLAGERPHRGGEPDHAAESAGMSDAR